MSKENIAWFAGMFEDEGCISSRITKRRQGDTREGISLRMEIVSTDLDVISKVQSITNAGKIFGPYNHKGSTKPIYNWIVTSPKEVVRLIALITPWLGKRRTEQAEFAIGTWAVRNLRCDNCKLRRFQCDSCYKSWSNSNPTKAKVL